MAAAFQAQAVRSQRLITRMQLGSDLIHDKGVEHSAGEGAVA